MEKTVITGNSYQQINVCLIIEPLPVLTHSLDLPFSTSTLIYTVSTSIERIVSRHPTLTTYEGENIKIKAG